MFPSGGDFATEAVPTLPYDTEKDFDPTLLIGTAPALLSTAVSKPYQTVADIIKAAKEKPGAIS